MERARLLKYLLPTLVDRGTIMQILLVQLVFEPAIDTQFRFRLRHGVGNFSFRPLSLSYLFCSIPIRLCTTPQTNVAVCEVPRSVYDFRALSAQTAKPNQNLR